MVDFNKQIKNSNKFREACLRYQKTGSYCMYPSGTTEFYAFWDEEKRRCIEGYTAQDSEWISGYNYFYLNYHQIANRNRTVKHKKSRLLDWLAA